MDLGVLKIPPNIEHCYNIIIKYIIKNKDNSTRKRYLAIDSGNNRIMF